MFLKKLPVRPGCIAVRDYQVCVWFGFCNLFVWNAVDVFCISPSVVDNNVVTSHLYAICKCFNYETIYSINIYTYIFIYIKTRAIYT